MARFVEEDRSLKTTWELMTANDSAYRNYREGWEKAFGRVEMGRREALNAFEKAMDVMKRSEMKIKSDEMSLGLRVKLASLIVHLEEYWSRTGHVFDKVAVEELLRDAEVREFVKGLSHSGLLPVKRK
jgi:hypothetical protein